MTTQDLGKNVAIEIAKDGIIKGLGAQRPYDQGVAEAMLAGYGLLGKAAPAYVALNALAVTKDNVQEAWKTVYHQDAPAEQRHVLGIAQPKRSRRMPQLRCHLRQAALQTSQHHIHHHT